MRLKFRPNIRLRLWPLPEEAREHIKSIWDKADLIKVSDVELEFLIGSIKAKDVYDLTSSGKGCSKRCREDFTKEKEDLELEEKFAQKLQSMGIPQQFDIDPTTTDGTSRDEEDNSNNNIEVENDFESDSKED
nr:fructokinase-2 [Quercus suber]